MSLPPFGYRSAHDGEIVSHHLKRLDDAAELCFSLSVYIVHVFLALTWRVRLASPRGPGEAWI